MAAPIETITPMLTPGWLLVNGAASIYGFGHSPNVTFGSIHQMSSSNSGAYSVGQSVLIPFKDAHTLSYADQTYWLIDESKIILVEQQQQEDIS